VDWRVFFIALGGIGGTAIFLIGLGGLMGGNISLVGFTLIIIIAVILISAAMGMISKMNSK
jgi:hypothetical protein